MRSPCKGHGVTRQPSAASFMSLWGSHFSTGASWAGCELTCVPTAGHGWPLLPPRSAPRSPHTPGGCARPWWPPHPPLPGPAGAPRAGVPASCRADGASSLPRTVRGGLLLSTPSGRASWLRAKSLVSPLVPLWHLKGPLLAAEDTGKLQALASWPPSFSLPFFYLFFSLLTSADLVFLSALEKIQNRFAGRRGSPERWTWGGCWWWPLSGPRGTRPGLLRTAEAGLVAGIQAVSSHVQ